MKSPFNWRIIPAIVVLFGMIVTIDQWTATTSAADPYKIKQIGNIILDQPFSVMSSARGMSITLTITLAFYVLGLLRRMFLNKTETDFDRKIFRWIISGIVVLLLTEALAITPYTMNEMAKTPTGIMLNDFSPILFFLWALLLSDAAIIAVAVAGLASLVIESDVSIEKPKGKNRERNLTPTPILDQLRRQQK